MERKFNINNNSYLKIIKNNYYKNKNKENSNIKNEIIKSVPYNSKLSLSKDDFFPENKAKKSIINDDGKETNIQSMNMILNKLIKLKNKINEINILNKKKTNLIRIYKPSKTLSKEKKNLKNKYLLYINDYYNNKKKLLLQKNKTITFETENNIKKKCKRKMNTENPINCKIKDINNDSINIIQKFNSLEESNLNKDYNDSYMNKLYYFSKDKNSDKKSFYLSERNKEKIKNHNEIHNHLKYIEKIKDNELMDLMKRYKKSINKNKTEENSHYRSLVFPTPLINHLIKMKKELIIDKYRNEYINKMDRYNIKNILSAIKKNNAYINESFNIKEDFNK